MLNNLNNDDYYEEVEEAKIVVVAIFKGILHASVVPMMIMLLINIFFNGNNGLIGLVVYVALVAHLYNNVFEAKDISKMVFNYTVSIVYGTIFGIIGFSALIASLP